MPIYVRVNEADQNTVANNNTALFNYAIPVVSKWVAQGGAEDDSPVEHLPGEPQEVQHRTEHRDLAEGVRQVRQVSQTIPTVGWNSSRPTGSHHR